MYLHNISQFVLCVNKNVTLVAITRTIIEVENLYIKSLQPDLQMSFSDLVKKRGHLGSNPNNGHQVAYSTAY